ADQADRQLRQVLGQRAVEAAIFAELLGPVGKLGPAQPGLERSAQAAARPGDDGVGRLLLLGSELVEVERGKPRQDGFLLSCRGLIYSGQPASAMRLLSASAKIASIMLVPACSGLLLPVMHDALANHSTLPVSTE